MIDDNGGKTIQLIGHHVKNVEELYKKELSIFERFFNYLIYGNGSLKKEMEWVRSLDPDTTTVEIINPHVPGSRGILTDSLCELCVYEEACSEDKLKTFLKMLKRTTILFPYILYEASRNKNYEELAKRGLRVGGEYSLRHILENKEIEDETSPRAG